jgi:hypothetical protein
MQPIWKSQPRIRCQILKIYPVLKEYEDVFGEFPGFPPKRDIDFSIDLMPGASQCPKLPTE